MPQPTREQIEAALERLPESQHAGFLAEVKRRMQPPRSMAPGRGSSFADISAWRQNTMGDLGRSEPQTPEEAYSGGRGASVALATTAAIAAPVAVAKMMGRGATAYAVEEGVDLGAQAAGVSPYWSDKAADAAGILSFIGPGGLMRFISRLGGKKAKKELKEKLVQVVVKSEKEKLRASAALRAQGYTSKQIDEAVVMGAPKIPTKLATSTAPPVAPKAPAPPAPAPSAPRTPPAAPSGRTLDPLKGKDFNRAGGSKAQRAAVEGKAQFEGRGLRPGPGWKPEGSFEPAKQAVKEAAKKASPGAVRAVEHKALVAFAKQKAKGHKFGQKVWMELDSTGAPVRVLTPDQAGAAARAGKATTWVKKAWKD